LAQAERVKTTGRKPGGNEIVKRELEGSPKVDRKSGTVDASRRFAAGQAEGHETGPSRKVGH
jgi:hypothetical protein